MTFLNHGSFGATPREVLRDQQDWRTQMERQPVRFFLRELDPALCAARSRVAAFLGAAPEDLAFVENATNGANAVLRSLRLLPGETVVSTSHIYNAVKNSITWVCERAGARSVEVAVPFPLVHAGAWVEAILPALGPSCRLLVLDHVCSASGLVLPVEALVAAARERGIPVLVDGAHAPGMLALDVPSLGATWYVGNLHKWVCAPKGSAFLWAGSEGRAVHPVVTSHRLGEPFPAEFDFFGTRDPSSWLATPAAIDRLLALGIERIREWNHRLAVEGAQRIAAAWGTELPAPAAWFGSIVPIAAPAGFPATREGAVALQDRLWFEHRIEVPVYMFQGTLWLRVSGQIYNEPADYDRLAAAVLAERNRDGLKESPG